MADYFLVHDPDLLDHQLRPALGRAWWQRRFDPCLELCRDFLPAARAYAQRYHIHLDETVLAHVEQLSFDRTLWRTLAGELLLFTARDVPELSIPAATLSCLLSPDQLPTRPADRAAFAPIHQALYGARELTFGPAVYRPEHAGLNHRADVEALAGYLGGIRTGDWSPEQLASLPDLDEADRADEVDMAREWFAALATLYADCARAGHVLVLEQIF
jgi:hypothetical protein